MAFFFAREVPASQVSLVQVVSFLTFSFAPRGEKFAGQATLIGCSQRNLKFEETCKARSSFLAEEGGRDCSRGACRREGLTFPGGGTGRQGSLDAGCFC